MTSSIMLGTISINNMAGGLERNIIYLANHLARSGKNVVLITFDLPSATSFYYIDTRVVWVKAGASEPHTKTNFSQKVKIIKSIRKAIKQYRVTKIICFTHGILARFLLAGFGLKAVLVCSERNSLSMYKFTSFKKWNLNFILLAFVKKITVQFEEYKRDYPFWLRHKITTIHNPIFFPEQIADLSQNTILAVGRLARQKRFDIIIRAFKLTLKKHPNWHLKIVGDGPLKLDLMRIIDQENLGHSVTIHASTKTIEKHYKTSTIFVIASQWEGFPNALSEALSYGLMAVGFSETKGVSQLIFNNFNGALASGRPSAEELANKIVSLIAQEGDWPIMSKNSRDLAKKYSPELWMKLWDLTLS